MSRHSAHRRVAGAALLLPLILAVAACAGPARQPVARPTATAPATNASPTALTGSPGASTPPGTPAPDHVVVAVFENKAYDQIAGDPKAPYLNNLMGRAAVFTDAHAVAHPSQPNYLALYSGSTQGVTDDHCPLDLGGRPNLGRQLLDAGRSFTGFSEDLPSPGYRGCTGGRYAAKHNPWSDFDNVPATANQPFTAFPADYAQLPTVSFVVPNLCNDMHDCGVAVGDAWARAHLDPYLRWADTHNSQLIVTFDENDNREGNQILTLFTGAGVKTGRHPEPITHYTVLRAIEDRYGLAPLGEAANAAPLSGVW